MGTLGTTAIVACPAAGVSSLAKSTTPATPVLSSSSSRKCTYCYRQVLRTRLFWGQSIRSNAVNSFQRRRSCSGLFRLSRSHSRIFASQEGVPREILEDSKFVPINDDDPRFGPPALLLLGLKNEEAVKVQSLLKEMEGDFLQVLLCTEEMAHGTLGKAFSVVQPNLLEVQVAEGLPRISFISGLTGEEIMMLIKIFPEAGLEATVFAAHVPLNTDKSMEELMEEIMDDHRRLARQPESASRRES